MNREDSPIYIDQGGSKVIADGVHQKPESIRLADMDGFVEIASPTRHYHSLIDIATEKMTTCS